MHCPGLKPKQNAIFDLHTVKFNLKVNINPRVKKLTSTKEIKSKHKSKAMFKPFIIS